jgi:hypothetical protein
MVRTARAVAGSTDGHAAGARVAGSRKSEGLVDRIHEASEDACPPDRRSCGDDECSAVGRAGGAMRRPRTGKRDRLMETSQHPVVSVPAKSWRAFRRLTQLSFPRSYPIVQFPNAPLILAFVSGILAQNSHGSVHSDAQAVSYLAMAVWAYLELFQGVNAFRRLLGMAYTISTVLHLATTLSHH